jgi:eukaryotic-like serine/threonine-protein kinase
VTSRPDLEPGLLLAGRYHLHSVLGRGGAGTVWRADDDVLDRPVAVKLLHPELERDQSAVVRFRREATAAAALTHPNAVIVYDIGEEDGRAFLVMELVDGVTLSDLLAEGQLAPDDVATIGVSVARALGAAHARGLVHRDVKPGNVLVTRDGVAKVADFGIATALGDTQARLTTPGMVVGTSAYLAPEQLEGDLLDARADVYSLGLVLHECLTGRQTFSGGTAVEVATRRLAGDVPPPGRQVPHIPEDLDVAVERATRRDPQHRYGDGGELAAEIARLVPPDAAPRLARLVASRLGPATVAHPRPPVDRSTPAGRPVDVASPGRRADVTDPDEAATTAVPRVPPGAAASGRASHTATLSTGPAPEEAAPADEPPPRRSRWSGPLPWILTLVVVLLFGLAILDVLRGDEGGPEGDGDGGQEAAELAVSGWDAYDPFGSSPEHPQDVPNAFDGDPGTSWQTQNYNSAQFGGLKDGVGFWFDLGESTAVGEIALSLRPEGADLTVYAGQDVPPTSVDGGWSPADWGTAVGEASSAGSEVALELDDVEARYVLVWFTSLPSDGGGYRVHVSDVTVAG